MKFSGSSGRFEKLKYLCAETSKPVNSYFRKYLPIFEHTDGEKPGKSPGKRVRRPYRKAT